MTHKYSNKVVSIGYYRDDGDFRILATANNLDDEMDSFEFDTFVGSIVNFLRTRLTAVSSGLIEPEDIIVLERQDTPDYVEID